MNCWRGLRCFSILWLGIAGCEHSPSHTAKPVAESYIPDANSVPFDIEPAPGVGGATVWLATYSSPGKTAKFSLELGPAKATMDQESKKFNIKTGTGRFLAQPGSDASALLFELKNALEARELPSRVHRVSSLPFVYVSFGERQSQAIGGGFNEKPPGNWTPMKISLGEGETEGEVFLNINPVIKKGQFSIKDEGYGDIVLAQLATVL